MVISQLRDMPGQSIIDCDSSTRTYVYLVILTADAENVDFPVVPAVKILAAVHQAAVPLRIPIWLRMLPLLLEI